MYDYAAEAEPRVPGRPGRRDEPAPQRYRRIFDSAPPTMRPLEWIGGIGDVPGMTPRGASGHERQTVTKATTSPGRAAPAAEQTSGIDPHAVTISGIVLDPVVRPGQSREASPSRLTNIERDIAEPGEYPYTRALFPAGLPHAAVDHAPVRRLRLGRRHQPALQVPARAGQDQPRPRPTPASRPPSTCRRSWGATPTTRSQAGEVGKCGVAIDTIEDMHRLYADIPLDEVTVSQTINGPAAVIWAMYLAMAKQRGFDWADLGGTLQNDILKEFHAQNEFIYPPEPSVKLVVDTIEFQSSRARAALELGLDLGLPHPRGGLDGGAGARLHAPRRHGVRRGVHRARARRRRVRPALSASSSTATTSSSRRSASSAPPGGSGPG